MRPAKLSDIVDAVDFQLDTGHSLFDRQTGKLVLIEDDDELAAGAADWEQETIQLARDIEADTTGRFVALPDQEDLSEYGMMEQSIETVTDESAANALYRAIGGRGAFRYFKDRVRELGLADRWYAFRDRCYRDAAKLWCEENDVPFEAEDA